MTDNSISYIFNSVITQVTTLLPTGAILIGTLWGVPKAFKLVRKVAK